MSNLMKLPGIFPGIPKVFDEFLTGDLAKKIDSLTRNFKPSVPLVNIRETKDEFEIELAAPGLQKDEFTIELDKNVLVISACNKEKKAESGKNYTLREFNYNSFKRSFDLPEKIVNLEKINATYEHGLLKVRIPKKEETKEKPVKQIEIA